MTFADPLAALNKLGKRTDLLSELADNLADVERKLEPLREEIEEAEGDYKAEMFVECVEKGTKLPADAETRELMAERSVDKDKRLKYKRLLGSRTRLQTRLKHLTAEVDALRSILSAARVEAEVAR